MPGAWKFAACFDLLVEGATSVHVAPDGLCPSETTAGVRWVRPADQTRIDPRAALAAHLYAGDRGEAVALEGYERARVRAVGFSYGDDTTTSRLTIHLPNRVPGYEPAEIVSRLDAAAPC